MEGFFMQKYILQHQLWWRTTSFDISTIEDHMRCIKLRGQKHQSEKVAKQYIPLVGLDFKGNTSSSLSSDVMGCLCHC